MINQEYVRMGALKDFLHRLSTQMIKRSKCEFLTFCAILTQLAKYMQQTYVHKVCMKRILRDNLNLSCIFCDKKSPEFSKIDISSIGKLLDICTKRERIFILTLFYWTNLTLLKEQIYFHSSCRVTNL